MLCWNVTYINLNGDFSVNFGFFNQSDSISIIHQWNWALKFKKKLIKSTKNLKCFAHLDWGKVEILMNKIQFLQISNSFNLK